MTPPRHALAARADPEAPLVALARQSQEAAVRELVRRMNPRLFRIARGIMPTDAEAEEVVQDAYLTAFTQLDSFRGEARFSTWISRITVNAALMRLRRHHPEKGQPTVTDPLASSAEVLSFPGGETAEASIARQQIRGILEQAVSALPTELRLPFLLHEVEGQPVLSIARDLGLNPITVRTRLFRARRRLRSMLQDRLRGGFESIFPFDGARCARMADRVIGKLRAGS